MLYLVATPIGHLRDITFRAIDTLKMCDYILCEDTRHSVALLHHYEIHKPLKSYHKFSEAAQVDRIIQDLKNGRVIGLISDAGTPGISDPGTLLIKKCIEEDLPVTAIPGPCAAIQALSCSGLPTDRFQFWGFLARKENELKRELQTILNYPGTTICHESPHRLLETLSLLQQLEPHRLLVVARELTKKFEEIKRGLAQDLIDHWQKSALKGEIVLLISPPQASAQDWSEWTPQEHVEWMQETYGLSRQEAIKIVANLRQVPKRNIYNLFHQTSHNIP
ncbi:MAG: 16S rRNA (cytidine(1402)-2'-O)-methyltransferase [Chlamydiales bacterium]